MVGEIHDVVALAAVHRPMGLGFKSDEIQRPLIADEPGELQVTPVSPTRESIMPATERPARRPSRSRTGRHVRMTRPRLEVLEDRLALLTTLSIANTSAIEPMPGGTVDMDFTVTRTGDTTTAITVGYTTVAGTAQPNTDFTPTAGTVTIASGSAKATIGIPIFNDGVYNNPGLAFSVELTGVTDVVGPPISLAGKTDFATGSAPRSVTAADLNGDGKPDMIVANYSPNTVSVLLNTTAPGATTPSFAAQTAFATGAGPHFVTAADVNGDGKLDLIVANLESNTVSVLLNATAPGATTPSFAAQKTFATGSGPHFVAVADVNGDGKPDLAVANLDSNTVSVLLNTTATGATTASFAAQKTFATGSGPESVTAADLNGDGKPDLAVANYDSNTMSVLLNTTAPGAAAPSFAAQTTFATGSAPHFLTAADVNGDGKPDTIFANLDSDTISVLLNTTAPGAATASFAAQQTFATGSEPTSVTTADLNGDGKPDVIVANFDANTMSVLRNTTVPGATTASFAAQQTFTTGSAPGRVTAADVNGDGKPDLIVVNLGANSVSVLLNTTALATTSPSFTTQQTSTAGSEPVSVTAADLNGDGKRDLVVANYDSNTVSVLLNTTATGATTASFAAPQSFAAGSEPRSVTTADLNGDGKPDVIVANYDSNTVSVLLNTTAPGAATASFAAQQALATGTGPISVTAADVNGDGKPDLVVANYDSATVSVLLNTTTPGATTPSFAAQKTFATGTGPRSVTATDLNGDGKPDLIVANLDSATVSVLLNTTAPGATAPSFAAQGAFAAGSEPHSVTTTDVNGDGKPDVIVANQGGNTVSVLLNTTAPGATTPSFAAQRTFATGGLPEVVTAADVNGDGKRDLIVANGNSNTVSVLLNTTAPGATTPSFAAQQSFAAGSEPRSVTTADLNGDGRSDLVVANRGGNTVSVLLNAPVTITTSTATGTIIDLVNATGVSSTAADGTYGTGAVIPITVTFAAAVTVTGTPRLTLSDGAVVNYSGGSGSPTLTFDYTVAAGQTTGGSRLDYASTTALALNGGTIVDANSNAAILTLAAPGSTGSLAANKNIVIDAVAPTVTGISSTAADGTYGAGAVITITIGFSAAVEVTGTPTLALNTAGGPAGSASYTGGSGTSTLTFTYTVAAGQATGGSRLDYASTTALALNGGTISDANAAILTLPAPGSTGSLAANKNIVIDAVAPTVTGISSTDADGTYGAGAVITITIGFSAAVEVTGTPMLALNTSGGPAGSASYTGGSGTETLSFTYTVAAGQSADPLDAASVSALTLGGGTIDDTVTNDPNPAVLTVATGSANAGALANAKSIVIATTAPTVTGVSSTTPDGSYTLGAVITITVGWSAPVVVTGTPQLALSSGGTASYTSGSGTSTLVFTYTVGTGQSTGGARLDAASAAALTGTITDTVANSPNAAVLTVPVGAATPGRWPTARTSRSPPPSPRRRCRGGRRAPRGRWSRRPTACGCSPPAGQTDLPWLGINRITITLSGAAALVPADVTVTGIAVANYGPVTIGGGGTTYTITLARAIAVADRVTVTVAGVGIATYTRRLDVLPGDFNDDGAINSGDVLGVTREIGVVYGIFADIDGDGTVTTADVQLVRLRVGTHLPPVA